MGVAGGINLYEYNGNDAVTWRTCFVFFMESHRSTSLRMRTQVHV
jgi:hypothetical protein